MGDKMTLDLDYGQASAVALSVLRTDYKALLEGLYQFDSVEDERQMIDAYRAILDFYGGTL